MIQGIPSMYMCWQVLPMPQSTWYAQPLNLDSNVWMRRMMVLCFYWLSYPFTTPINSTTANQNVWMLLCKQTHVWFSWQQSALIHTKCSMRSYDLHIKLPSITRNSAEVAKIRRDFPKQQASGVSVILCVF